MGIPSPAVLVLPGRGSTGLQPFRYHALRGNPSGEEVRDDPHSDNRRGSNRCSVAPTAPPLKARVRAFGLRPLYCPWPRLLDTPPGARPSFCALFVAQDLRWCEHDYASVGRAHLRKHCNSLRARLIGFSHRVGAPTLLSLRGSGLHLRQSAVAGQSFSATGARFRLLPLLSSGLRAARR
jgi:hypothetical protein